MMPRSADGGDSMRLAVSIGFWVSSHVDRCLMNYEREGFVVSTYPTQYDIARLAIDIAESLQMPLPGWGSTGSPQEPTPYEDIDAE